MSGVYFQGMKMPEACSVCPAHHFYFPPVKFADDEVITTAVPVCMAVGKELPTLSQENRKPDWCPAFSVPDHGRLIDAAAFSEKIIEIIKARGYDDFYAQSLSTGEILRQVVHELRGTGLDGYANAPTIIPGDKKEVSTDGESV